jgi:hypothetical protein
MSTTIKHNSAQRRRGVSTMLYMVCLSIFVMLLMLVVNYTYLVYSQLRTGNLTDLLVRTAAPSLLDEGLLDSPSVASPLNDLEEAAAVAALYLDKNNQNVAPDQQLKGSDLTINGFRVENVNAPFVGDNLLPFDPNNPGAIRLNTLMIAANRPASGDNPLLLLVRSAFTPEAADIGTVSFATLDSRLIGLEPTAGANTPVMPIGIFDNAWKAAGCRSANLGGKPRKDFRGTISGAGGTLVLLSFDQSAASFAANSDAADQIRLGLGQTDINIDDGDPQTPAYFLGPVVEGTNVKVKDLPAQATINAGEVLILQPALQEVIGQKRVFPLCSAVSGAGKADIVGFVAATILDAQYNAGKLELDLEPEFIIHYTAKTAYQFDNGNGPVTVPENVYIHKLRLSR